MFLRRLVSKGSAFPVQGFSNSLAAPWQLVLKCKVQSWDGKENDYSRVWGWRFEHSQRQNSISRGAVFAIATNSKMKVYHFQHLTSKLVAIWQEGYVVRIFCTFSIFSAYYFTFLAKERTLHIFCSYLCYFLWVFRILPPHFARSCLFLWRIVAAILTIFKPFWAICIHFKPFFWGRFFFCSFMTFLEQLRHHGTFLKSFLTIVVYFWLFFGQLSCYFGHLSHLLSQNRPNFRPKWPNIDIE